MSTHNTKGLMLSTPVLLGIGLYCLTFAVVAALVINSQVLRWVEDRYGPDARERVIAWQRLVSDGQNESERTKVNMVNKFFNRIPYRRDHDLWKKKDYWATPIEAMGMNGADCEDYSIAKYFTLRELGVPDEKLRIAYVKAIELNEHHMVLTYYEKPDSIPLVLDNLKKRVLYANRRKDLKPIYSFNGAGLWLSKARGQGKLMGSSKKLTLWADLQQRMQQEMTRGS